MPDALITLIVALIAASPGIYAIFAKRGDVMTQAATRLVEPLSERIDALETEVQQLRTDNRLIKRQNREMAYALRALWVYANEYVENYGDTIPASIAGPVIDSLEGTDG